MILLIFLVILTHLVFSFNFKREIFVTHNGATVMDAELLITINTLELISMQKILQSCQDIAFIALDNVTTYSHWVEAGCNTPMTSFWVRIPILNDGGIRLFLEYGDDSFTQRHLQSIHTMYVPSSTICTSTWNKFSDSIAHQRFIASGTSHGITTDSTNSHRHEHSEKSRVTSDDCDTFVTITDTGSGQNDIIGSHKHRPDDDLNRYDTEYSSFIPHHMNVQICSCKGYYDSFPIGSIVMADNSAEVPVDISAYGWELSSSSGNILHEKFLRISVDNEGIGDINTEGHVHEFFMDDNRLVNSFDEEVNTGVDPIGMRRSDHSSSSGEGHTWYGVTSHPSVVSDVYPAHTNMLFYQNVNSDYAHPFEGMIIFSNFKPVMGYSKMTLTATHNVVRGNTIDVEGTIVGASTSSVSHYHDLSLTLGTSKKQYQTHSVEINPGGTFEACHIFHSHGISEVYTERVKSTTPSGIVDVDTYSFIFYKRKSSFDYTIGNEESSIMLCYGLNYNDDRVCNKGKGICVGFQTCKCHENEHYYGIECKEYIYNKAMFLSTKSLQIQWVADVKIISDILESDDYAFDCSKVIHDIAKVFQSIVGSVTCKWEMDFLYSSHLLINFEFDQALEVLNSIEVITLIPISGQHQNVEVAISPVSSSIDVLQLVFFITVPLLLICIVIIGCVLFWGVIFAIIGRIFGTQKKKLDKFHKLDNLDAVLKEREFEDEKFANIRINRKLFEIDYNEIKLMEEIGSGGSGNKVFKCEWKGLICAFKLFRIVNNSQENFSEFEKEVEIVSSVRHPHILSINGVALKFPKLGFVTTYCKNGDLIKFFGKYNKRKEMYPLKEKIRMIKEMISAMKHLHSVKIIHRDFKSANVLVNENEETLVMDFGLSKEYLSNQHQTVRIGTSHYISPEMYKGLKYTGKADVFSFGIVCYELLSQNFSPFGEDEQNIEMKIANDPDFRPEIDPLNDIDTPVWLIALIQSCWDQEPRNRKRFVDMEKVMKEECINFSSFSKDVRNVNKRKSVKLEFGSTIFDDIDEVRKDIVMMKIKGEKLIKENEKKILDLKRKLRKAKVKK